jgi:hypothetical protein
MKFGMLRNLASKAHSFLKGTKAISRLSGMSSHPLAQKVHSVSSALGYGRRYRRRRRGGALKLAGMGMGLAGGRRRRGMRMRNLPMAY